MKILIYAFFYLILSVSVSTVFANGIHSPSPQSDSQEEPGTST